jgi:putative peptide zinc metalloprotease protein
MAEQGGHPALRGDLQVSRVETPEGASFVLKDPRTRSYFRLREVEYAVARRLDGATPVDALPQILAAEFDVEVDADSVAGFAAQLRRQGLLEGEGAPPVVRTPFVQGPALYLRFRALDPDRLLDWLHQRARFFFTPQFVVASAIMIAWAVWTSISERDAIWSDLTALWSFQNLFLAWVVILCVVTMHEFAHGLTCKHFGGHVHEMGFLLIYFQPAFYCNISDAWLFPKKSHRLWVTAAGAWFELFIWSLATLAWTVLEPGTWPSGVALIVMATSAIKQFFNLNPLIKLDGYYLLGDLLDVPNLRQRAVGYLRNILDRVTGGTAAAIEASRRERMIFASYGVLAIAFSWWFLGSILFGIGGWLTDEYQAIGAGAFAAFLGLVFPQPLRRLFKRRAASPSTASPQATAPSSPEDVVTNPSAGVPADAAPNAPRGPLLSRRASLWTLAASLLLLSFVARLPLRVGGEFRLLPDRNADIQAPMEGMIAAVYADEGDVVHAGDTIARLSDTDHRARLSAMNAQLAESQARLRLMRSGPRREEISLAELNIARAEDRLRYAKNEADRAKTLAARDFASPAELQRAEEQATLATRDLEQERARLVVLRSGSRPDSIAAMEQEVARVVAERDRVLGEIGRLALIAPHDGMITTPRLHQRVGQFVRPGDLIAEVHAVDRLTAEIRISERDLGEVRIGSPVALRSRVYPDRTFEGTVTRIAAAVADTQPQPEHDVRVEVDLVNDGSLRPGMTGFARVSSGSRPAIDVITRRFRRFIRVEFWSWW